MQDFTRLESFIFDKMAASGLPGLSLALLEGDRVIYSRGFGQRNLEKGLPATADTLYGIGSVTKSFTALATLQLAERSQLDLSDPVGCYLPYRLKPKGRSVRVRHLLTHALGIPALAYSEALIRHANDTGGRWLPLSGPEDILTFMEDAEGWAETEPGERWFYANEGYAMLGAIIQAVSGKPYNDYIKDAILTSLGMTRSFFRQEDVEGDGDVAVPYVLPAEGKSRPGRYVYRTIRSEGGLISSVLELCKYLRLYLEGGKGIISEASLNEMLTPRLPLPHKTQPGLFGSEGASEHRDHYGYGLETTDFFGETLVHHGGSVLVSTAHLAFLPTRKLGVAVLANGSGHPLRQIAELALALMLEREPEELTALRLENTLDKLTGSYETYRGTMTATIKKKGDFLELLIHDGAQPQTVVLVPERLDGPEKLFFTLVSGTRLEVVFRERQEGPELLYERYKLRRVGP